MANWSFARQAGVVLRVKKVGGWEGGGTCVPVELGLVLVRTFAAFGPWGIRKVLGAKRPRVDYLL